MENKTCPKCNAGMQSDKHLEALGYETELVPEKGFIGDKIRVFYCGSCGYMELYQIKKK